MDQYRAEIVRIVDGDIYEVNVDLGLNVWVRGERIRLAGVKIPVFFGVEKDTEAYRNGKAAFDFVKGLLKKGDPVIFETRKEGRSRGEPYLVALYLCMAPHIVEGMVSVRAIGNFYCLNDVLIAKDLAETGTE